MPIDNVRVVFTPSGRRGTVPRGSTALAAARSLGVDLDTVCGGRGICGRCQVVPSVGSFPKWGVDSASTSVTAPGGSERDYRGARPLRDGRRLGCAMALIGDVVIDVPAESQVHHQVVRKSVDVSDLVVDPMISLAYVELPPTGDGLDGASSMARVIAAIEAQHGLSVVGPGLAVLAELNPAIARGEGCVTVALGPGPRRGPGGEPPDGPSARSIVAVWPGFVDAAFGVAIDVGSTTIAAHLCDLASGEVVASKGRMNPQIRFGEDLMSRVSYVMMHAGGERELTAVIREAINGLIDELLSEVQTQKDRVLDVVIVGNPIMHHLVLGFDPTPLGQAPFQLVTADPVTCDALEIGIDLPWASVYVGPCIAGHVGADTAAAMLAEGPHRGDHPQLLVDVGTNAEIVLGDRFVQYAASSPTGPAFEGAQLSCGQRATAGAIERVRVDPDTLEPRVKVIGCDLWSDAPGFAESTRHLTISGVCGSGVIEAIAELFLAGVVAGDGTIVARPSHRVVDDGRTRSYLLYYGTDRELFITQQDVRAIQLAKAALRAGIDLLLERSGYPHVTDIRLAGAFGAHIDPFHAMVLGLVPDAPLAGVRSVGNAAGNGAVRALLSGEQRREMEAAARAVIKIETALEPRFQALFVDAMAFPHAWAPTPNLAELVTLPSPTPATPRRGRRQPAGSRMASPVPDQ